MIYPLYKLLKAGSKISCRQHDPDEGIDVQINFSNMSNKMKISLGKYQHAQAMKKYERRNPEPHTRYFLNPMRPGVRLTRQERRLRINRYKIKRNKRRWGLMEYRDLGRRDYVNRRLRVKGRFISKEKAIELLFGTGPDAEA